MPTTEQRASLRGSREVQFKPEADEDVLEGSPVEAPPSPTAFLEFNERVETQLIADKVRKVVRDLLEDMAKQGDGADENTELLLQDFDKKQLTETIRTPASGLGKLSGNVYGFLVHAVCSVGDGATTGVDCTEGSGWRAEKMTAAPVGQLNVASICRGTRRAHWVGALGDALKGAADEIGRLDSSTSEKELQQTIEQIEHVFEASFFGEKQENWCESAIARQAEEQKQAEEKRQAEANAQKEADAKAAKANAQKEADAKAAEANAKEEADAKAAEANAKEEAEAKAAEEKAKEDDEAKAAEEKAKEDDEAREQAGARGEAGAKANGEAGAKAKEEADAKAAEAAKALPATKAPNSERRPRINAQANPDDGGPCKPCGFLEDGHTDAPSSDPSCDEGVSADGDNDCNGAGSVLQGKRKPHSFLQNESSMGRVVPTARGQAGRGKVVSHSTSATQPVATFSGLEGFSLLVFSLAFFSLIISALAYWKKRGARHGA